MLRLSPLRIFVVLCCLTLAFPALAENVAALPAASPLRAAVDEAVAKVKPALVRIRVVWTRYSEGREVKYEASGSGAIITPDGYVVTNHHVAGHASRIFCTLSTREVVEADLIGTDALTDIAVIKLDDEGGARTYPTAAFGDSSIIQVGDHVLAMGSPRSLSQSVTLGIISNTEMVMPSHMQRFGGLRLDGEDVGSLVVWIGHDADIYPGNSGGPLVNLQGEIIGINEISLGLGGAIPGNLAQEVATKIIELGEMPRAWIGVQLQPLLRHGDVEKGVLIQSALKESPADKAGIQPGDILVQLAGEPIVVRFDEQLPSVNLLSAGLTVGEPVEAVVLRDGEELTLSITPVAREKTRPQEHELKEWGITARDISFVMARMQKRDSTDGVSVSTVAPGGPVADAKPPIDQGDVIVAVNGTPVKTLEDLITFTEAFMKDKDEPAPVLVDYERRNQQLMTVVEVGLRDLPDPARNVRKAWLGVEKQVITRDLAEHLGDEKLRGFRVTQVFPGTAAEEAGLQVGDLITEVDGMPLEASSPEDYEELDELVRQYKIDTVAQFRVVRGEEVVKVSVKMAEAPLNQREMKAHEDRNFDFKVRDITFLDHISEEWDEDQTGVLVTEVKPGGWAAVGGLDVQDLIVVVNDKSIATVEDLERVMADVDEAKPKAVVLQVKRGIGSVFLELEPNWDTAGVAGKES